MPAPPFCSAYALEAKQIQTFILDRTRMREMVGASSLVDSISASLPDTVLATLQWQEEVDYAFCRRGAGGFTVLLRSIELATRLQNLFSLLLPHYAPGLVFVDAIAQGDSPCHTLQNLRAALAANAQTPALRLPLGSPLAQRAQRSGRVANDWQFDLPQDSETINKSRFAKNGDPISAKFAPGTQATQWPIELNPADCQQNERAFPFRDENAYVGILHIDGNGLGQALQQMRSAIGALPDYAALEYRFSQLIESVACQAAQQACKTCLLPLAQPVYPARPLVLGGDDLTIIVRADRALAFAREYIAAWEGASRSALAQFQAACPVPLQLPPYFSACAGLVFVRAKYPFYLAYQACENLCARAKRVAKAANPVLVPSAMAFGRITNRWAGELDYAPAVRLEGSVYATGAHASDKLPPLAALQALLAFAANPEQISGKRNLVELHSLLQQQQGAARRYQRWQEVMQRRDPAALQDLLKRLQQLGTLQTDLPIVTAGAQCFSPVGDVLALLAVQTEAGEAA